MFYVVGSGPGGVACAYPLVKKGLSVTMLDVGLNLEPERQRLVDMLGAADPDQWEYDAVSALKGTYATIRGVPQKRSYGSDYPYRDAEEHVVIKAKEVTCRPSFAKGGLSTAWGAGMMPFLAQDIKDWPISSDDLAPHYRRMLEFTGLAAAKDDLAGLFPLYTTNYQTLQPSAQAAALLKHLEQQRARLRANGFMFGSSRLAVEVDGSDGKHRCAYCGLCMYGCPYRLIYNSAQTVNDLARYENFSYMPDVLVEKVIETEEGVEILARTYADHQQMSFKAERVFLACGAFSTTKIVLESMEAYDKPVTMKDSQYFLLPLLLHKGVNGVRGEQLHTMAQLFIEIFDQEIGENPVHLSVYTYNDFYRLALQNLFGPFSPLLSFPIAQLLNRLIIAQGYLHSNLSPGAEVRLSKTGDSSRLLVKANPGEEAHRVIRRIVSRLVKHRHDLGLTPISPLLSIGPPGHGLHIGGTFPMKESPGLFESDLLGRPYGFERVHLVDASNFPSIASTTIAFTIMANAHRIASQVAEGWANVNNE